jgi:hypothetical protein
MPTNDLSATELDKVFVQEGARILRDLTGQVFGRLTALQRLPGGKWLCRCECGSEKVVFGANLETTKSCGCLKESRLLDLTAQVFGRLTVLRKVVVAGNRRHSCWLCICECGNEVIIKATHLVGQGTKTKSCGCLKESVRLQLTGQKFGRYTVVRKASPEEEPATHKGTYWLCRCECGNERMVRADGLKSGRTLSCGCFHREEMVQRITKHGKCEHPLYVTWCNMKSRCNDSYATGYERYGGRGIFVCPQWEVSFVNFLRDVEPTWRRGLSLDRIDNHGPYAPWNCRWATPNEQLRNTRPVEEAVNERLEVLLKNAPNEISSWLETQLAAQKAKARSKR